MKRSFTFFDPSVRFLAVMVAVLAPAFLMAQPALSGGDLDRVGKRIWQNECAGTVEGLTSWNTGENFASLGIGHFIWYPEGVEGPFEESFPKLVQWLGSRGVRLPNWLAGMRDCPWPTRAAFLKDSQGPWQRDLRTLLAATVREQTLFIMHRLQQAEPKFRQAAGRQGEKVARNMALLRMSAAGNFAMIDYVNFKGEGLNPKERYRGEGWGLLQVLTAMETPDAARAPAAFAAASERMLARRVANSPPERGEKRWMAGWANRCRAYGKPF
ncbi:hypothetical protein [Phragmitibacter flavus]|nr:hypothetical protein [Phragmitibacter flavus]